MAHLEAVVVSYFTYYIAKSVVIYKIDLHVLRVVDISFGNEVCRTGEVVLEDDSATCNRPQ